MVNCAILLTKAHEMDVAVCTLLPTVQVPSTLWTNSTMVPSKVVTVAQENLVRYL